MRFSVKLPTEDMERPEEFLTAEAIADAARAAEAAGFDAGFVSDHPIPGDRWLAGGGHHTLDPFVVLGIAAEATRSLRLQTNVLVLPYRNPFLTAKAAASLDVASGGRVILGVAAGYETQEFAALGVPFAERNDLADEAMDVMVEAWTRDGVVRRGRRFDAPGNTARPRPVQVPHPPLWVGGNSRRAIRRAVERGDGWVPFPAPARMARATRTAALRGPEDLAERLAYARDHARAVGRTAPLDVAFVPFGFEHTARSFEPRRALEQVEVLEPLGVTWLLINVPGRSRAEWAERVAAFGAEVIAPLRDGAGGATG